MSRESKEIYEFGPFRLDVGEHLFERTDGEKNVPLPEKAFQTLIILVRSQGRLITKSELLDAVWPDSFVEENNLDKAIHAIRHALGDSTGRHAYIETVRKHGYRFIGEVLRVGADSAATASYSVSSLDGGVLGASMSKFGRQGFQNAYEAYQEARIQHRQMTAPSSVAARALVGEALRLDPHFALAHCLATELSLHEVIVGLKWPEEGFAEARASIDHAGELGADSPEFHSAAAYVALIADWGFAAAKASLEKALTLNPNYGSANRMLGEVYMFQGYPDAAEVYLKRAQIETELPNLNVFAIGLFLARDYSATLDVCKKMLELAPGHIFPAWIQFPTFEQIGRVDEGIEGYEKLLQQPNSEPVLRWAGNAYALAGKRERALEIVSMLDAAAAEHNISPTHSAAIYASLGEIDTAVSYIEKGLNAREPFMLWIATDPRFDTLRGHPRFEEIVQSVLAKGTKPSKEGIAQAKNLSTPLPKSQITASGQHALLELSDWRDLVERLDTQNEPKTPAESSNVSADHADLGERNVGKRWRASIRWIPVLGLIVVLGIAGFLGAKLWRPASQGTPATVSQKRLTTEGGATRAAISPDGRYAAVAQNAALILFDLQSGEERVLLPASKDVRIMTIGFPPDGAVVYFGTRSLDHTLVSVYSLPLSGGEPKKILDDIYGSLGFSPDGKKIAFVRRYPELNEYALLTADSDGSDPSKLASSRLPDRFDGSPAWSPDGNKIVCSAIRLEGGFHFTVARIDVSSGAVDYIPEQRWKSVGYMSWLADSRSMVMAAQHEDSINMQVWSLDSETGATRRITDDSFVYESISGSTDGRTIVAVKVRQTSHVWMIGDQIAQLTAGFDNYDGFNGLAWSADESIFYHSRANGRDSIWRSKPDGTEAAEVTRDAGGGFAVSPDGRTLVFQDKQTADHLGLQIMDLATGSVRSLTHDMTASQPDFFPDGKRIVFSLYDKKLSLYEVPVGGGEPKMLSDEFRTASTPAVSPSGKLIAFAINRFQDGNLQSGIAVIDSATKKLISSHVAKITLGTQYEKSTIQWSTDESEIYFLQLDNSVSNIMKLRLADGTVSNVTNFTDGRIFNFAVEPGGKRILIARGIVERDASLLQIDPPM